MTRMTFIGRTAREAMQAAKARFGADVEILGSRQVSDGVELTARIGNGIVPMRAPRPVEGREPTALERATTERPMSTVSFEEFVRSRQESAAKADGRAPSASASASAPRAAGQPSPTLQSVPAPAAGREARPAERVEPRAAAGESQAEVMRELQSIRQFIAGQLETVRWFDTARRRPAQLRLLKLLLGRGFSPVLARSLCDLLPVDFSDVQADRWLAQTLERTLAGFAPAAGASLFDGGGVFALTGPTGVGKTTTIAKIAAQYALKHGAAKVALITADVYRIGAQDQLRSFGRLLGVPVHVAHDRAALADLLGLFAERKLVLIDTAGVGQRDPKVAELLAALDLAPIQRLVVLNAAMQAASLQDVVGAYRAADATAVILSKVDEAVQLGAVLDVLLRNRLALRGVCDGQRVPEDFQLPDLAALVATALQASASEAPDGEFAAAELRLILEGAHV